jgi:hypothetical protein
VNDPPTAGRFDSFIVSDPHSGIGARESSE